MKKIILSAILSISCVLAFSQYKFTVNIQTKTLSGKKIHLNYFDNKTSFIPLKTDTIILKNGNNVIRGEIKQPSNFAAFVVRHKGKVIDENFVLDSGVNNINLDLSYEGSKSLKFHSDAKGNLILKDINSLFLEIANRKKALSAKGYVKMTEELNSEINEALLTRLEAYPNDFSSLINLYRISYSDHSPYAARKYLATLAKLSDELKNSVLGKQIYSEATNLIKNKIAASVGNEVKAFTITDLDNNLFSNSSFKGQPYMIVFSATWCGPCQLQLPKLKKIYETYKEQGLRVVYFNDDDDVIKWRDHVKKNNLTWINVSEKLKPSMSKIPKSFGVFAIPTCLIVNKKGTIVYNSDQSDPEIYNIEKYVKQVIN
ncbi:TlpA family protein disulfide reductase [Pedobacter soli]|uniref:Thioredoxin-like n=1 Tax=Pedobacter soli TaxID=390242 RepID=A0A1G6YRR9_9SPHI|nr:TlpA disulfide reductase family protein [Pedobacter soli]SDD92256.1 Thioredoxin-like [Pedobacter soli]